VPPLVDAPPREHERLPQFEPAEGAFSAAKVTHQPGVADWLMGGFATCCLDLG
jgi:hypothetical protein